MTRNLKRFHESGQAHFITFSCYRRMQLLNDEDRRGLVVDALERTRQTHALRVYGYVVLPEHVHDLISEPEVSALATAMQALKLSVVRRVTHSNGTPYTRFWQSRYYDHNVRNCESFVEKLGYIHNNPVKRGLVERPEDWQWSSARHYLTGEIGPLEIESEWTARRREGRQVNILSVTSKSF